jgi:hypothetical protein
MPDPLVELLVAVVMIALVIQRLNRTVPLSSVISSETYASPRFTVQNFSHSVVCVVFRPCSGGGGRRA